MTLNNIYYIYYIHNTESLHGHKTHKMLWSFEIQTDYQISARWPDLVIVEKKENLLISGFCRSSRPQSQIKRKRKKR